MEPDPTAGQLFRRAAVKLRAAEPDSEAQRDAAAEAGAALVGLALAENENELRALLTPDPVDFDTIWTVACYQIGDLTPSALRDFADPVEAVATVAACPDESHVAAELVASTSRGLRWTAVTRTNDKVAIQLPSSDTASDGSREHPSDLAAALRRWKERLNAWSDSGGEPTAEELGVLGRAPVPSEPEVVEFNPKPVVQRQQVVTSAVSAAPVVPATLGGAIEVDLGPVDARLAALERRLAKLEVGLGSMTATLEASTESASGADARRDEAMRRLEAAVVQRIDAPAPPALDPADLDPIDRRLAAIERTMSDVRTSIDAGLAAPAVDPGTQLSRRDVDVLEQAIDLRFRALAACFNELVNRFADQSHVIEERLTRMEEAVDRSVRAGRDDILRDVRATGRELESRLDERVRDNGDLVIDRADALTARIEGLERRLRDAQTEDHDGTTRRLRDIQSRVDDLAADTADRASERSVARLTEAIEEAQRLLARNDRTNRDIHRAVFGNEPNA